MFIFIFIFQFFHRISYLSISVFKMFNIFILLMFKPIYVSLCSIKFYVFKLCVSNEIVQIKFTKVKWFLFGKGRTFHDRFALTCSMYSRHPCLRYTVQNFCFLNTRVGTLIVATIYSQLIQNRYMFRSFTVLQCSHRHCVQPVARR